MSGVDAGDRPPFSAPWQAQVFAMTVALHERGVFSWPEWTEALGARIALSDKEDGSDYYDCWAAALAGLLVDKGLVTSEAIEETVRAWHVAAARTPHGSPITLDAP